MMKYILSLLVLCCYSVAGVAATYVQPLNCQATSIALNSPSTSATVVCPVVPPPPPTACPSIHSATTGISSFNRWAGDQTVYYGTTPKSKDVTSFDDLYGAYPGQYGLIATFPLPARNYLSIKLTLPPNYTSASNVPVPLYGAYAGGETGNAAQYSMTISTSCGDFSNPAVYPTSTVILGCWRNLLQTKGLIQWRGNSSNVCLLHGGETVFLNIINGNISKVQPNGGGTATSTKGSGCSSFACSLPIMDGPGTWGGYVPK